MAFSQHTAVTLQEVRQLGATHRGEATPQGGDTNTRAEFIEEVEDAIAILSCGAMNGATDDADGGRIFLVTLTPATQCASTDREASRDITPGRTTSNEFGANISSVASCTLFGSTLGVLMSRTTTTRLMGTPFTTVLRNW
jgi:hypothetical protein